MRFNLSEVLKNLKKLYYPLILCGVLVASICLAITVYATDIKTVTVNYDGKLIELSTDETTVEEALKKAGIVLDDNLSINCDKDAMLSSVDSIEITKKDETVLSVPGEMYEFPDVVYQSADFQGINLSDRGDSNSAAENNSISTSDVVEITYETSTWEEDFETEYRSDSSMYEGDSKVIQNGKKGIRTVKYQIKKIDGQVISKDIVSSEVTQAPVKKIVVCGTKQKTLTAKGKPVAFTKVYSSFKATAYTADDKWGHATASGMYAQVGVIAVDPRVIPMGTKVYIEGINGAGDYGYAIAGDTGGAIKGNIIDLYKNSESECYSWGVKYVNIYVLEDQSVDIFSLRK